MTALLLSFFGKHWGAGLLAVLLGLTALYGGWRQGQAAGLAKTLAAKTAQLAQAQAVLTQTAAARAAETQTATQSYVQTQAACAQRIQTARQDAQTIERIVDAPTPVAAPGQPRRIIPAGELLDATQPGADPGAAGLPAGGDRPGPAGAAAGPQNGTAGARDPG